MKKFLKLNLILSLIFLFQINAKAQDPCLECIDEPIDFVCIEDEFGEILTLPNLCFAECLGFSEDDLLDECDPIVIDTSDCICPTIFDPVCVESDDGILLTFPNACLAECEGFEEADFVECDDNPWNDECIECLDEPIEPVCVLTDEDIICPFPNACFAECAGYTEDDFLDDCDFEIDTTNCNCTFEFDPVCVTLDDGTILNFPNACLAECEGFEEADFVECDDNPWNDDCIECLDEPIEPVCVETDGGLICPFPNACYALCAGYTEDDFLEECDGIFIDTTDCVCPAIFDPVCVETVDGLQLTFPNACFAECAGFTDIDFVECDSIIIDPEPGCDCDLEEENPVCVELDGIQIELPNACFVTCILGLPADEIVDCDDDSDGLLDTESEMFIPALSLPNDDEDNLIITPNPVENTATLSLIAKELTNANLTILSLNGNIEWIGEAQLIEGENQISLNTSQLKSGVYFLRMQTKNGIQTIRFVK